MSSARRPLLTAAAAGALLGALWFVPSAHAEQEGPRAEPSPTRVAPQAAAQAEPRVTQQARAASQVSAESAGTGVDETRLADTGSFDTTPYIIAGSTLLAVGAGFVAYSVRRERLDF